MSFVVALALAVGALVAAPFLAHLLRRSRAEEREFPPAHLVPVAEPVARQRSRLEDRSLLAVRALMVFALAVLGATPLVRCSRLSIARQSGGSVALAIIVDDSLSMRARTATGRTRFELASAGARDLLAAAREGDAVAIVAAGAPARLTLSATTDLGAARRALAALRVSDRPTDLESAVQLARSSVKALPHPDRKVILLSDFAGAAIPSGEPAVWAPLAELRKPSDDCGVVSAASRGRRVTASIACSSGQAARGRLLELVVADAESAGKSDGGPDAPKAKTGDVVASAKLDPRGGEQSVSLEPSVLSVGLEARLTGKDAIAEDDRAPVAPESQMLGLGVLSDVATATATTGGATVVEQALEALSLEVSVRPLSTLPDDAKELAGLAVLLLDDPSGIAPEARGALMEWLERGGVAATCLGPSAESVQLGTTLEPFARGAVRWEATKSKGVDPTSLAWLGEPGASLASLAPRGRARLDSALPAGAKVIARWDDAQPFLVEQTVGRGVALSLALPTSPDESDLALRPGFLALLEHLIDQASRRVGPQRSVAGTPWTFPASSRVEVEGPEGPLKTEATSAGTEAQRAVVPDRVGRYRVSVDGNGERRIVTLDAGEVTTAPKEPDKADARVVTGGVDERVDVSSEVALSLLALLALELVIRAASRFRPKRARRRGDPPARASASAGG